MKCGTLHLKKRKLWIWIAIDRYTQEVLGFSIESRRKKAYQELIRKIKNHSTDYYCTDKWKMYKSLPIKHHRVGKKHTTQIESLNANVRHYFARFRRKTRCYSKSVTMVELFLFLLFFNYVLDYLF